MEAKYLLEDWTGLELFSVAKWWVLLRLNAFLRSRLYFLNTSKLYAAPSSVNWKLNSGGVGVVQGVLRTSLILLKRLLGQSNNGCGMMSWSFLSGGFIEVQGKFWHSPSSCANLCADDAKAASRCAFPFHAWDSCWGTSRCASWCADDT